MAGYTSTAAGPAAEGTAADISSVRQQSLQAGTLESCHWHAETSKALAYEQQLSSLRDIKQGEA